MLPVSKSVMGKKHCIILRLMYSKIQSIYYQACILLLTRQRIYFLTQKGDNEGKRRIMLLISNSACLGADYEKIMGRGRRQKSNYKTIIRKWKQYWLVNKLRKTNQTSFCAMEGIFKMNKNMYGLKNGWRHMNSQQNSSKKKIQHSLT